MEEARVRGSQRGITTEGNVLGDKGFSFCEFDEGYSVTISKRWMLMYILMREEVRRCRGFFSV